MRKSSVAALAAACSMAIVLAGAAAQAAPLAVSGTLGVAVGQLGGPQLTGTGIGSSSGGVGTGFTVPAALLNLQEDVSVPISPPALGLSLIKIEASPTSPAQNPAGAFAPMTGLPNGGTLGGAMGNNAVADLYFGTGAQAGTVPLNYMGGGGTGMAAVATLPVTIIGAVWNNLGANATTPTKQIKIQKAAAGIPVTVTATAFDKRTAGGAGLIQLVAPASAKLAGGALGVLPVVGILTLEYSVPEPGALLLGGSAMVALLALARRRHRA